MSDELFGTCTKCDVLLRKSGNTLSHIHGIADHDPISTKFWRKHSWWVDHRPYALLAPAVYDKGPTCRPPMFNTNEGQPIVQPDKYFRLIEQAADMANVTLDFAKDCILFEHEVQRLTPPQDIQWNDMKVADNEAVEWLRGIATHLRVGIPAVMTSLLVRSVRVGDELSVDFRKFRLRP